MDKQFFFISGLPRSGSSLLCNILNQNSDAYASPTSGLPQVIKPILTGWDGIAEFKANSNDKYKVNLLKGIFDGYYQQHDKKYIFDKSRAWPTEIESLTKILKTKPKIIICVRDVRDILSSWEKMYRRDKKNLKPTPGERQNPNAFINVKSRCKFWSDSNSPLGSVFNVMNDAYNRGFKDNLYIFEFEKWTNEPYKEFDSLYEWLEIPPFIHNFENIKQVLHEKDEYYGYTDLHNITEGKLTPSKPQWPTYLGEDIAKIYESSNTWKE